MAHPLSLLPNRGTRKAMIFRGPKSPPRGTLVMLGMMGLILAFPAAGADPENPFQTKEDWMGHMKSCLKGVWSLEAHFQQETIHPLDKSTPMVQGTVQLRKKGRIRLEYEGANKKILVSDGTTIRAWNQETGVMVESPAGREPLYQAFMLLLEPGKLETDPFATRLVTTQKNKTGETLGVLSLEPTQKNPFASEILLTVRDTCPPVKRVVVVDHAGSATRLTLDKIQTNGKIPFRRFSLPVPKGVKIVHP